MIKFQVLLLFVMALFINVSASSQVPPACKVIREVRYPVTKTEPSKQPLRIALLDLCPKDRGMVARPMLAMTIKGEMEMFEYDVIKVFKDQAEADLYAKENNIIEPSGQMIESPETGCRIIRRIPSPLSKRPNPKVKPKSVYALLNICLSDKGMIQRPVVDVVIDGKKETREFEVAKIFKTKAEAREYAKENNISDAKFSY